MARQQVRQSQIRPPDAVDDQLTPEEIQAAVSASTEEFLSLVTSQLRRIIGSDNWNDTIPASLAELLTDVENGSAAASNWVTPTGLVAYNALDSNSYSQATQEANLAAILAAIALARDSKKSGVELPAGFFLISDTIEIVAAILIRGAGRSFDTGTNLGFPRGVTGIRVKRQGGPTSGGSAFSRISDLRVLTSAGFGGMPGYFVFIPNLSGYVSGVGASWVRPIAANGFIYECTTGGDAGAEPTWPTTPGATVTTGTATFTCRQSFGIEVLARVAIQHCSVDSMTGHGIGIVASTADGDNANLCLLFDNRIGASNGKGIYCRGEDANVCVGILNDVTANLMDGIDDASFLGGYWFGNHADANGMPTDNGLPPDTWNGRPFKNGESPDNASSRATFVANYVEGGQAAPQVDAYGSWLFGLTEAGVDGSGWHMRTEYANTMYFLNRKGSGAETYIRLGRPGSDTVMEHGAQLDGYKPIQLIYGSVDGNPMAGAWSELYNGNFSRKVWFDDTFVIATEEARATWYPTGIIAPRRFFDRVADRNGSTWDTGKVQSNRGATGTITYNLPGVSQVPKGHFMSFRVSAAFNYVIKAQGSDVIRFGDIVSTAAGTVQSAVVGDVFTIEDQGNGEWRVVDYLGSGLKVDGVTVGTLSDRRLTGDLTLAVAASGGSDTNAARVGTSGDLSAQPFASLAGALAYLPHDRNLDGHDVTIVSTKLTAEAMRVEGFVNGKLTIDGAVMAASFFRSCPQLVLTNCVTAALVTVEECVSTIDAALSGAGGFSLKGGRSNIELVVTSCSITALKADGMSYLGYSVVANGCTATPVDLVAVQYSEPIGAGISGTNASAAHGVRLSAGGKHVLTGADITSATGTALDLDGNDVAWSALAVENYHSGGTFAYWSDSLWVDLGRFRIVNNSSLDFDDFIVRDFQYGRFFKQYGLNRPLDPAYTEITAHSGGGQVGAVLIAQQVTLLAVVAAPSDSVRFFDSVDIPGAGGGTRGEIINGGASTAKVWPKSGKKIYLSGADLGTDTSFDLAPGERCLWVMDNAENIRANIVT